METIDELMRRPATPATAAAILAYVRELPGRVLSGDMMVGLLTAAEIEKAPAALALAAGLGERVAWLELARWHANPPFGEQDLPGMERALEKARAAGVQGADLELVRLRWFYRRESATPEEQREAFEIARALAAGTPADPEAIYFLGLLTCQGFGAPPDPAAAVTLQRTAADLGHADAMFELCVYYANGIGLAQSAADSFAWMRKAAQAGQPRAMYNMGACCATGRNTPVDLAAAADWYARASDRGNLQATAMLATMYARGEGVERDEERALELFDEADYLGFDTSSFRAAVGLEDDAR